MSVLIAGLECQNGEWIQRNFLKMSKNYFHSQLYYCIWTGYSAIPISCLDPAQKIQGVWQHGLHLRVVIYYGVCGWLHAVVLYYIVCMYSSMCVVVRH